MEIKMTNAETFLQIFNGAKNKYGICYNFIKETGEKLSKETPDPLTAELIENHLNGKTLLGRSPVDEATKMCEWLAIDIDKRINPKEFSSKIWSKLGWQFDCIMTPNKRWRVIQFLDEPMHVEEAAEMAKELEQRIEKDLNIVTDKVATCPTVPNGDGAVGRWMFLPYSFEYDTAFTPDGRPLNLKQFMFRHKYRKHLPVVAAVGMLSGSEGGGRNKAFMTVQLYKSLYDCDVSLEELNDVLDEPLDQQKLHNYIKGVERSVAKDKYDEQYYLNAQRKWIKEICQVEPYLDAKGFSAITEAVQNNHIYVQSRTDFYEKETDLWLSKEQIDDWWKHEVKSFSKSLLQDSDTIKVRAYLTHAGLPRGLVSLNNGDVKGLGAGDYLNIYEPCKMEAVKGDVTKINEYYSWLLGADNRTIIKQKLAFMLNAEKEYQYYLETGNCGLKVQWFTIMHSKIQGAGKKLFAQVCQSMFGFKNVRPNVKFEQMTGSHSTIIEGAQLIFLNEVVMSKNTAKTKELSNNFKDLITEDNLFINPKNKPQIEIPNLCNFFVFSNADTPLHIENEDRRAFVINIKHSKEQVTAMLETEGYKWEIIKHIKNPAAFKYHLLNEVEYDRNMFFEDAPFTADKQELIDNNKDDITSILEDAYDNKTFPFANYYETRGTGEHSEEVVRWRYDGLSHPLDMYLAMKQSKLFKGIFFQKSDIENFVKAIATKFPNGQLTKQAIGPQGKRKRLYATKVLEYPQYPTRVYEDGAWIYCRPPMILNVEATDKQLWQLYTQGQFYDRRTATIPQEYVIGESELSKNEWEEHYGEYNERMEAEENY